MGIAQFDEQMMQVSLSGLKGEFPWMILVLITLKVSNTGMHSVATVKGIRPRFFTDRNLVVRRQHIGYECREDNT